MIPLIPFTCEQLKSLYKCNNNNKESQVINLLIYSIYSRVIEHAKNYESTHFDYYFDSLSTYNGKLVEENSEIIVKQMQLYFRDCDIKYYKKLDSDEHYVCIDWE